MALSKDESHKHHIPFNKHDFQPLSTEVSPEGSESEDVQESGSNTEDKPNTGNDFSNKLTNELLDVQAKMDTMDLNTDKSFQTADLEEVPRGIVRQATSIGEYEFPTHRFSKRLKDPNKLPLVIVACGSFSPITYLHLRMFEMALDAINEQTRFEVVGGYYSPVNDTYRKPGLAPAHHRVRMCELACERTSTWLMVDAWESLQPTYTRTAKVLDHFNHEINVKREVSLQHLVRRWDVKLCFSLVVILLNPWVSLTSGQIRIYITSWVIMAVSSSSVLDPTFVPSYCHMISCMNTEEMCWLLSS